MKWLYLLLCIAGTLLPLSLFGPWVLDHGLAITLLIGQAFATPVAGFAWMDVLVSAVVVLVFVVVEGRRLQMRFLWLPFLAMFTVGVSLALPLFLLMREFALDRNHRLEHSG